MEKRPSAAVAALLALFISSFTGLSAFAEEPTYSETKSVPMEQPKKKDQPVQKADGEIFQENLETHNALLNTPTQTEVTDEGMALREQCLDIPAKVGGCMKITPEEAAQLYTLLHKILGCAQ